MAWPEMTLDVNRGAIIAPLFVWWIHAILCLLQGYGILGPYQVFFFGLG